MIGFDLLQYHSENFLQTKAGQAIPGHGGVPPVFHDPIHTTACETPGGTASGFMSWLDYFFMIDGAILVRGCRVTHVRTLSQQSKQSRVLLGSYEEERGVSRWAMAVQQ
jgi:hypothetical protein